MMRIPLVAMSLFNFPALHLGPTVVTADQHPLRLSKASLLVVRRDCAQEVVVRCLKKRILLVDRLFTPVTVARRWAPNITLML